jgi:transcriptional antiterminator RfaH
MDWYVAYSKPGGESRAKLFLEAEGATVYLPMYRRTIRHSGRVEACLRPVFPRYLFFTNLHLSKAKSTPGVSQVVQFGGEYVLVGEGVIQSIRDMEDETGAVSFEPTPHIPSLPHKGGLVRITDGPFEGHLAIFDGLTEDNRVRVLLHILRRQMSVELPDHEVERP